MFITKELAPIHNLNMPFFCGAKQVSWFQIRPSNRQELLKWCFLNLFMFWLKVC